MNMRNNAGSASQYKFTLVPDADVPRSKFLRYFGHKTTINTDYLIPIFWDEILPGDTYKVDSSIVARMSTLLAPIMDNMYLDVQAFFVPNRLLWDDWQRMNGERKNPTDSIDVSVPYVTPPTGGLTSMSLGQYLGLPLGVEWSNGDVMALPFRAYNLIWNEWYRDENLQNSVTVNTDGTIQSVSDFTLLKRGKRKDYFTSCLPAPQKGPAVVLPLGDTAPVIGNGNALGLTNGTLESQMANGTSSGYALMTSTTSTAKAVGTSLTGPNSSWGNVATGVSKNPDLSGLIADLSSATSASVNAVRQAFQLQRLLERDARGGTRYIELIRSHFNVVSPDARLQRPEFLGSFTIPVSVHSITQTSESATTPQGTLTGVGTVNGVNRLFTKSFTEHGILMILASVRADLSYQQGIARKWSRRTRYDFYLPALAHLGEQDVKNKEIYAQGPTAVDAQGRLIDELPFGYQERWSEYKFGQNLITGDLASTATQPLDSWHLAQDFGSLPTLNAQFIESDTPLDRCLAVTSAVAPQLIVDSLLTVDAVRPLPLYDIPGFVDHF